MDIKIAQTSKDVDACIALRHDVFVLEQGFAIDHDAIDETCQHIVLRDGNTCIGTARIFRVGPIGKIGRICVAKTYRGQKLGLKLVQFALDEFAKDDEVTEAFLSAQVRATAFYETLGFEARGAEYLDEHVPHIDMFKSLQ